MASISVSSSDGRTTAQFVPEANLVCASLRHDGAERLDPGHGLEAYAAHGKTMGIPLLHPWANRLGADGYSAAGKTVSLAADDPRLSRDPNGLPIHGIIPSQLVWEADAPAAGEPLHAALRFEAPELLELFPFVHRLEVTAHVETGRLTIETELVASGEDHVPVSFGYHPYLRLDGAARESWEVTLAARQHVAVDERQIPTGERTPLAGGRFLLAEQSFDDGLAGLPEPARFQARGDGGCVAAVFAAGYPFAQLYAPAGKPFVCFEPMTAEADALRSGRGLSVVAPGERYGARFSIELDD